jgi:hypothetical protein
LTKEAEGKGQAAVNADIRTELTRLHKRVQEEFAPLAFLYDLRVHGGLAHPPSPEKMAMAAGKLGLPRGNWHRTDYLSLLRIVTESFNRIAEHFEAVFKKSEILL